MIFNGLHFLRSLENAQARMVFRSSFTRPFLTNYHQFWSKCSMNVLLFPNYLILNQASISLLLKKNKDPLSCTSYRPISLLSVDVKLLSKLLALRLESVLPLIISPDQTGFVQNRHGFFNLRGLLNVVYNPSTSVRPEAVISLELELEFH